MERMNLQRILFCKSMTKIPLNVSEFSHSSNSRHIGSFTIVHYDWLRLIIYSQVFVHILIPLKKPPKQTKNQTKNKKTQNNKKSPKKLYTWKCLVQAQVTLKSLRCPAYLLSLRLNLWRLPSVACKSVFLWGFWCLLIPNLHH